MGRLRIKTSFPWLMKSDIRISVLADPLLVTHSKFPQIVTHQTCSGSVVFRQGLPPKSAVEDTECHNLILRSCLSFLQTGESGATRKSIAIIPVGPSRKTRPSIGFRNLEIYHAAPEISLREDKMVIPSSTDKLSVGQLEKTLTTFQELLARKSSSDGNLPFSAGLLIKPPRCNAGPSRLL
jgi:hypothetical protein